MFKELTSLGVRVYQVKISAAANEEHRRLPVKWILFQNLGHEIENMQGLIKK